MRTPARLVLFIFILAAGLAAHAAGSESIDLGSPPRWLVADGPDVAALLEDGRVVSRGASATVRRADRFSPQAPLLGCFDELVGIGSDGALISVDADKRTSRSAAELLSPLGGLACGLVAIWGIAPNGDLLRLERQGSTWIEVKRVAAKALPDARVVRTDLSGRGHPKLFVLAEGSDNRYRHGVLGDAIEATALLMIDPHSLDIEARLALPAPAVFEDLLPRPLSLAARPLLALVSATPTGGAALMLLGLDKAQLKIVATGPDFGQPSRWLNPLVGAHSLYAVLTPHIGGMLYSYRLRGRTLATMPLATGVSTHTIGSRQLDSGLVIEKPSGRKLLLLPAQSRSRLIALDCNGTCEPIASFALAGRASSNLLLHGDDAWIGDEAGFLTRITLPGR